MNTTIKSLSFKECWREDDEKKTTFVYSMTVILTVPNRKRCEVLGRVLMFSQSGRKTARHIVDAHCHRGGRYRQCRTARLRPRKFTSWRVSVGRREICYNLRWTWRRFEKIRTVVSVYICCCNLMGILALSLRPLPNELKVTHRFN